MKTDLNVETAGVETSASAGGATVSPEVCQDDVFVFPATPGQYRFWSLDQLYPGNPALNMPLAWRCRGVLNYAALSDALTALVERHEVLRTTFEFNGGKLFQVIGPAYPVALPVDDLQHLPDTIREDEAAKRTLAESRIAMDLKHGPLLHARLLKMASRDHILLITLHHAICDGWSNGVVLQDVASLYDAVTRGAKPALPEMPIQYADFAQWQEDWMAGEGPKRSIEHWKQALGNRFPVLDLQRDFLERPTQSVAGEIETLLIPPPLAKAAREFCAKQDVTIYMLLLSAFAALIQRLSGQDDFLIGSPCANRRTETENLIGLFANPQVLRIRLQRESSFRDLLGQVRAWTSGAFEHQDMPFESLLEDPYFSEDGQRVKLQVYFLYQKAFMKPQQLAELQITPIRSVSPGALFDLMLGVVERAEGPRLQLEYDPRSFRASTIQRFLRMYVRLLEAALANPSDSVRSLAVLSNAEREQILTGWNQTAVQFEDKRSIYQVLEDRAARTPDSVAVVSGNAEWTYRDLNEASNRLAHYLQRKGVRSGTLVGICVERSVEMLAAVLAVGKAGGAYVPLDARHPADRLSFVLNDAQAPFLLTDKHLAPRLKSPARITCLDVERKAIAAESPANLATPIQADSLAYVIYTSGSTGQPKGVAIEHRALMNLLRSMAQAPGMTETDVLLAVTTLSFDIAVLELFLPLLTGARVVIATAEQSSDGFQLAELMKKSRATVLQATPGTWRLLIEAGWGGTPALKMLCGGEALPRELADQLLERGRELWNMYGPTETTVWSSVKPMKRQSGPVTIGAPIANTQFYVLDPELQPAPIGVTGELFIGGAGLARGYWGKPELTAERFIANPFGSGRLYRTGDLARWQEDGQVELLGRTDHQVKIRGYRIELGEIESVLLCHHAVKDAVAVAQDDGAGQKSLAAYVAVGPGAASLNGHFIQDLRNELMAKLPDYMMPAAIVPLDALPRTPNGKIDRKALPAPHLGGIEPNVPPRNSMERKLAGIWASVLGLESIGIRSNFFDMGGNSLLIMRLIPKVNAAFGSLLPIPTIFSAPTVEKMAEVIRGTSAGAKPIVLPLQPAGTRPPFFLIHSYHLYRALPAALGGNQPFYGIQEPELADRAYPYALKDLAASYVQHLRMVQPHGPYYIGGFCFSAMLAYEVAVQLEAAHQKVALLAMIDATCPYYWLDRMGVPSKYNVWKRRAAVLRYHSGKLRQLAGFDRIAYVAQFIVRKFTNQCINLWLKTRISCYGYFLRRGLPLPKMLNDKLIVANLWVKDHFPKPVQANIHVFPARDQPPREGTYEYFGWEHTTSGNVSLSWINGNHDNMFLGKNLDHLAEQLLEAIDAASQPASFEKPVAAAK